ncbi:MAG: hypothetical protein AB2689_09795 [Candidatus Thiodiazotropha taylori]
MKDWVKDCALLLGKWSKVSASRALVFMDNDSEQTVDEILMGYELARTMYDEVFIRFSAEKQTLSDEGKEKLEIAVNLAKRSIPKDHPLLHRFIKNASYLNEEYINEVKELE